MGQETSYNTEFPQLEDDASGWDAAGTPKRYMTRYATVESSKVYFPEDDFSGLVG